MEINPESTASYSLATWSQDRCSATAIPLTLADLFVLHGSPEYIRSDNGSEFTATNIREWFADVAVNALFIEPESPWENGYN